MVYLQLFYEFFKAGLFAIGGGLATLPFLSSIADRYPWFDQAMLADMVAVSESTPGPLGINMATYAGFQAAGVLGGLIATIAEVMPSIIVIIIVAKFLEKFNEKPLVQSAFYGLRPAVTGLIAGAAYSVVQVALFSVQAFQATGNWADLFLWKHIALFAALLFLTNRYKKHPIVYIGLAAAVGWIFKF